MDSPAVQSIAEFLWFEAWVLVRDNYFRYTKSYHRIADEDASSFFVCLVQYRHRLHPLGHAQPSSVNIDYLMDSLAKSVLPPSLQRSLCRNKLHWRRHCSVPLTLKTACSLQYLVGMVGQNTLRRNDFRTICCPMCALSHADGITYSPSVTGVNGDRLGLSPRSIST